MTAPGRESATFSVEPDELIVHAGNVDLLTAQLLRATDAGRETAMSGEAFGLLVSFVGTWFQEQEMALVEKYQEMTDGLDADAQQLRSAAAEYRAVDRRAEERSTRAGHGSNPRLQLPL